MKQAAEKRNKRIRRHARVRVKVVGTNARPRLAVFRSLTSIYAQLIDDVTGKTLASVSSKDVKGAKGKTEQAFGVGKLLAEKAKGLSIASVVFDRGGFAYHGRVKALADAAREGGLQF